MNKLLKNSLVFVTILFLFFTISSENVYAGNIGWDLSDLDIDMDSNGMVSINQYSGSNKPTQQDAWNTIYIEYKEILVGISGVLTLTFVALFMKNIWSFANSADNPQERQRCLKGILWTGIGSGGFAIITLVMAMAFKFFQ